MPQCDNQLDFRSEQQSHFHFLFCAPNEAFTRRLADAVAYGEPTLK